VTMEQARAASTKFAELDEALSHQFPGAPERVRMHEVVRALIDWMVGGLLNGTVAAAGSLKNVDAVRQHPQRVACFTPEVQQGSAQLKSLLRARVYESDQLAASRSRSAAQMQALFRLLMQRPELLPAAYREESAAEPLHRQVCDYIAGMTDGFFARTCAHWRIS